MGPKSSLYQISSGYLKALRYFFLALAIVGLLGIVTGAFAQSQVQQQQLTLTLSNVRVATTSLHLVDLVSVSGTIAVSGPSQGSWSGGPLHFGGWAYVTGEDRFGNSENVNITLSSGDFNPSTLDYPASSDSSFSNQQNGPHTVISYALVVRAYDQSGQLVGTSNELQGAGQAGSSANLFILTMEIPLFQVPALGISAGNPDFSGLFATFDQLPLGDFYMLLAEVAVILLVGAGLINVIMYVAGNGAQKGGTTGTLAGLSNVLVTLLLVFLLPFAYNAVAGFVNVLDQQIIAGPGNPYTSYLANSQLIWNTLPSGGNILTDFIGAIASLMAWVMSWLLGSARIFLIGAVIVAMPIVLVLREIRFTARFAGVVEDTFFGLIFASVISALFIGLAAYTFNHWDGSMFQAGAVDKTWVALASLMGAILAPTVFAPMTGVFFQTMSQVGMAATGTAVAIGAGAGGPGVAGIKGGLAMAGQAVGGLANPQAGFLQKAGAALGGFGGGFAQSAPHMAQNMVLMGTVGMLGGLGASRSASAINRAIDLKMPAQTKQDIIAYRAGMLTNELQLPHDMKGIISRTLGGNVPHDRIRELDLRYHNDLDVLRDVLETEIANRRMR